ncbi:cation efflux family-domain-containing protein [Phlyctochytrium arcticum]|nr:cation efflux family-domain-containing protein [Phlyctochytrium arcticum]
MMGVKRPPITYPFMLHVKLLHSNPLAPMRRSSANSQCLARSLSHATSRRAKTLPIIPLIIVQKRLHGSHGHSHGPGLLASGTKEGTKVTVVGIGVNLGLTVSKGVGGILWQSASLLAEAAHSLSDLLSDFVTLYAYRKARAKPSAEFPLGFAKLEPMGSLIVSGLLVSAGVGIAYHSLEVLLGFLDISAAASAHHHPDQMSPIALHIMLASVLSKEAMFQWTICVARRARSDVLIANAWHHRTDAASSLVGLAGVGGAVYGLQWLDPVGGLLISGMVLKAGVQIGMPALRELLDASADGETVKEVETAVKRFESQSDVLRIGPARVRKSGPFLYVDAALYVNPEMTVQSAALLSEQVRQSVVTHLSSLDHDHSHSHSKDDHKQTHDNDHDHVHSHSNDHTHQTEPSTASEIHQASNDAQNDALREHLIIHVDVYPDTPRV